MRLPLLLVLFSIVFLGCQAQTAESDPLVMGAPSVQLTASSTPRAAPLVTSTLPVTDLDADTPSPTPTQTRTSIPSPDPSVEAHPPDSAETTPVALASSSPEPVSDTGSEDIWGYRIVNEYPHDPSAYTQGLVIEDELNTLLEGTGRDSSLRRVELMSGETLQYLPLHGSYFGEGITQFGDRIYQLTWQSQKGFIYDSETFELLGDFFYPHEGWGLTHDGERLIVSDGSDVIRFWKPDTFQEVGRIQVADKNGPVVRLNELEYVNGEIWANVWHTDLIARISPADGRVLGWIDLSGLQGAHLPDDPEAVLNGIAYHDDSGRLFVTGKLWPSLYEIEIVENE